MANIVLLLCIILLVFGVSGVTFFGEVMPERFGDLQTTMYSLFICVTQDGWVQIFEQFRDKGTMLHVGGAVYFFFSIMLGAFVFANLVVAVVVTNLEFALRELREEKQAEVDTLSTTKPTTQDLEEFGIIEDSNTVNIKAHQDFMRHVDPTTQTPLQITDLKGLTNEKIETYFLLLIALEENLCEYQQIRYDLRLVYEVVQTLNMYIEGDDEGSEISNSRHAITTPLDLKPQGSSIQLNSLKKGDILSNLMELDDKANLNIRDKPNMDAVIRSVREPAPSQIRALQENRRHWGSTSSAAKPHNA